MVPVCRSKHVSVSLGHKNGDVSRTAPGSSCRSIPSRRLTRTCGPQLLDRRCPDHLDSAGISYGMIGA